MLVPMDSADSTKPGNAPVIPQGEAAQERVLTGEPLALGYKPRQSLSYLWGDDALPAYFEILRRIPAMIAHPIVADCLNVYKAGIYPAKFEVKASSEQAGKFALAFIRRFWSRALAQAQLTYHYGWSGFEPTYEDKGRLLQFKDLLEFQPHDSVVLTRKNKFVGVRVSNVDGSAPVNLWAGKKGLPAKGFWLTHCRHYHRWHGRTQLYGAFRPWFELATRDGLEEITGNAIYRFAYTGPIIKFPKESEKATRSPQGADTRNDMRDKARDLADNIKTGGSIGIPSDVYPETKTPKWEVIFPQHVLEVSPLVEADKYLCDKISFGVGVPPELRQASETGSGYSGRNVTKETFYVGQQHNADEIVRAAMEQIGSPLICWNFGPREWAEVTVKPLLESQQQQSMGQPGADGGAPGGAPPGGPPGAGGKPPMDLAALLGKPGGQQQMSLRSDGVWLTTHTSEGDTLYVPGRNSVTISTAVRPGQTWLLPPAQHLALEEAYSGSEPESHTDGDEAHVDAAVEDIAQMALDGYTRLLARVRKEIVKVAKETSELGVAAHRIEQVLRKYEPLLIRLLTDAGLAAKLVGAWGIVQRADAVATGLPPSAAAILSQAMQGRPQSEIDLVRSALGQAEVNVAPEDRQWSPPEFDEPAKPVVVFPVIEEAAADIASRQAMTRGDFDRLHGEARTGAFTVAGLASEAAISKVRDAAAVVVAGGLSKKDFAQIVEEGLGSGTWLSPGHMETVFRAAVMSGYAAGQDRVLDDPRVGDAFPYVARYAIRDQRVRPQHFALESCGIQGTNIYRRDDPVWQKFRAPWSWNCRCNDSYLTIKQAADRGIQEAIDWLATGQPPANPTFVPHPPFEPPPDWQRMALEGIGVQWLGSPIMSATTPGGHTGKLRLRDSATHRIIYDANAPQTATSGRGGSDDSVTVDTDEEPHKFASTQFNLTDGKAHGGKDAVAAVQALAAKIADEDLAEEGRSEELHITVKYGLHRNDSEAVKRVVQGFGAVVVRLGKTSLFTGGKDGDVVKVDVDSPRLRDLNKLIADQLPNTEKYPEYKPHLTLAYIRPGSGAKYQGDATVEGVIVSFDRLVFSGTDGTKTVIALGEANGG